MNNNTLAYTKLVIPKTEKNTEKIIYCPLLDTKLFSKSQETLFTFPSLVDSGADFCVFPAKYGELIGINVRTGEAIITNGVGGQEILYMHNITFGVHIKKEIWKFTAKVGFSIKMNAKGNGLLGRKGFFDKFTEVSFNQKKKMFRLKE